MKTFNYRIVKDPAIFKVGVLPAHSDHIAYATAEEAVSGVSSFRHSLNGVWKFHYARNYLSAIKGFEEKGYDCKTWDDIRVPAHIQMEGYDAPAYVNIQYPWDGSEAIAPGDIPEDFNPVASYVKYFTLPEQMKNRPVYVSFLGVESGFALWLNGQFVGYSEDSFTPSEFELTPYLIRGENKLAVQVFKWTGGSWLEDQDFYRFSGIFRDVFLFTEPETHIRDLKIRTLIGDDYKDAALETTLFTSGKTGRVEYSLSYAGREVLRGAKKLSRRTVVRARVAAPFLWSAETPHLYDLTLRVFDDKGKLLEVVPEKVGFRRFEMKDGLMLLNGKRIVFRGVNRHEFSCDKGRVPDFDEAFLDVTTMKRNNINAVRTCHYPDAAYIYRLCDVFGLYMIAETNVETHGVWDMVARGLKPESYALPGNRKEYLKLILDRANSNYQVNKNHPSILIWSDGNESYGGKDFAEMTKFFHETDPDRLVHYEGVTWDNRYPETTDMYSQMYTPADEVRKFIKKHKDKPFILCEYAHAMANSCGALFKYTDLAEEEPRYQGGFIWDYVDQAIRKKNRYGEWFHAYGGDCGERPTDYAFCGDGIVDASRRPYHGKMQEIKFCYQAIRIEATPTSARIMNRNLFLDTELFDCFASLAKDGDLIARTRIDAQIAPLSEKTLRLPFNRQRLAGEYAVTVSFCLKQDTLWAKAGHEVAFGQCVYRVARKTTPPEKKFRVVRGANNIGVKGEDFSLLFSTQKGALVSYRYAGRELLLAPPRPNFWRAPTDNDYGNQAPFRYGVWKTASLYQELLEPSEKPLSDRETRARLKKALSAFHEKETAEYLELSWMKYVATTPVAPVKISYRIYGDGRVRMALDYTPVKGLPPAPEFGFLFQCDADFDRLTWYGMGPEECYCDRDRGARLGVYAIGVADNLTPYLVPQECGNRTGVRWAKVTDRLGRGLLFEGDGMNLSALHYTPEQLEAAAHPYELPKAHNTIVRCSLMQMGVAGDDGWGARTHDEFLLSNTEPLHFEMAFRGI